MSEVRLRADGLTAGYGRQPVVRDLHLEVHAGEVVVLLGPNGAGKTTTLLALVGEIPLMAGTVEILGESRPQKLFEHARRGLRFIPESRGLFAQLTVAENVRLGRVDVALFDELAPELRDMRSRKVAMLSGGEQQILALARGLASKPRILVADELSLGLAPKVVARLLTTVRRAADDGAAVLLVEQHAHQALAVADRGYLLSRGAIQHSGTAIELVSAVDELETTYLANASG